MVFSFQFISIYLCLDLTNNINKRNISTMGKISNNTNNNKGFTLVEVLLLIVVLILVGGLGYLGYKQVNKKSTTSTSSTNTTTTKATTPTTTPTPNQNIIKIPELGIQITVPDSLKDLTYTAKTENGNVVAYFSTTTLDNLGERCSYSAFGALEQFKGKYTGLTLPRQEFSALVKEFSTFYITHNHGPSVCSESDISKNSTVDAVSAVFTSTFPSITQLP